MEIKVIDPLLGEYTYTANPQDLCHLYAEGDISYLEFVNELHALELTHDEIRELKHEAYHLSI